ncbi:hypothetical protein AB0F03_34140 [Streptomyces sp. NPDC028722]|uniref:hypothetical protein n=1 Tax=Streptomyces sp. NPDC028722 TaxID=3155016 RepID=UPI0033FC2478
MSLHHLLPPDGVKELTEQWPDEPRVYERGLTDVDTITADWLGEHKLSDEDRPGLTALFWSNVNPYGTFRLDMDKRLDLGLTVPRPREPGWAGAR